MVIPEIILKIKEFNTPFVCITGGEPLSQQGSLALMRDLLSQKYTVSLETNGSFLVKEVPQAVIKVIDIKCPGSGESEKMAWENVELVQPHDQFKFVVASKEDFDWAQEICCKHDLVSKCHILYSPVYESVSPKQLAEWILSSQARVTMQVQLHKEIWGPNQKGV